MTTFVSLSQNFLTAPVLFFVLGAAAGIVRSNLHFPRGVVQFLSIYLMMSIGLKGGIAVAGTGTLTTALLILIGCGLVYGLLQPVIGFWLLRYTTTLDRPTRAAVSAHYGSISVVTFAAAVSWLDSRHLPYAGVVVAIVALMEAPAIVSGLMLARENNRNHSPGHILSETLTNGAVFLLLGAFIIGALIGPHQAEKLKGFVFEPFQGLLCLFLLEMGLTVSRNLKQLSKFTLPLLAFGIYMPLIGATLGIVTGKVLGLDYGTAYLFTVLCASASYIAVPAAMRTALPEADPAVYVPLSIGVTFPFNILIGLPLYGWLLTAA